MAITIKSIELCNFYNYYGDYEKNRYDFEVGANIVVADNGAGKSKLFNSLLWIFKDKVLDSDATTDKEQNIKYPNTGIKVVSDKAKKEAGINKPVECGVKLTYDNGIKLFEIHKKFYIIKKDNNYTSPSSWSFDYRDVEITYKEEFGKTKSVFGEEEKMNIINNLIRSDLRHYSFFQGEEVDNIIDFSDSTSIKKAIDILAKVTDVDDLTELSTIVFNKSENDLKRKRSSITTNNNIINSKERDLELEKRKVNYLKTDLARYQDEWERANIQYENYERSITNAKELSRITAQIKEKLVYLKRRREELEAHRNNVNDRFFNGNYGWLSLGMQGMTNKYYDVLKTYRNDLALQKSTGGEVYVPIFPIGSIDVKSLEKILEDDKCHVCDRSFEDDQKTREVIQKLKDWVTKKEDNSYKGNDFQEFFDEIQLKSQPFEKKDVDILKEIKEHRIKEIELDDKVKRLLKEIKTLNSEKFDLVGKESSVEDDDNEAKDIINGWKSSSKRRNDNENKINSSKSSIIQSRKIIASIKEEINKYSKGSVGENDINLNHMLQDITEAISDAKSNIYSENIEKLEESANHFYSQLIKYNKLKGANLKFDKLPNEGVALTVIGSDGHRVTGNSEGFQRIRKLAVVMGIISLSKTFHYPLFADAPLSSFGKGFIKSFFEVIPEVFPQSIILIKDIYKSESASKLDEIGDALYKDKKINRIYLNELPQGVEQNELSTIITKLK